MKLTIPSVFFCKHIKFFGKKKKKVFLATATVKGLNYYGRKTKGHFSKKVKTCLGRVLNYLDRNTPDFIATLHIFK